MNNILVTGSNGQLGSEIREIALDYKEYTFLFTDISDLDITNHSAVAELVKKHKINIIINCAAYTAVDKAESEPELSNAINHIAVANFAKIAKENNIKLIHISTDYVFDGNSINPYIESHSTNPQSVYGLSKLKGEISIKKINPPNSIIIRTSWLYSKFGNNFVKKMLDIAENSHYIKVVSDQIGSPTNAFDLACAILKILPKIRNENVEIYHYSNLGSCSWYDFSVEIFKTMGIITQVNPVKSLEYTTKARRPNYSVMNCEKIIKNFKITIPHWKESLTLFLNNN